MGTDSDTPWTKEEFEQKLREKEKFYHIHHEFHILMNSGKLEKPAIQGWVANRFYYQTAIPVKDAAIMANCPDRDVRRHWVQRIIDHDGVQGDEGGIEAWLLLGEAVGLQREDLLSHKHLLPGVRFAIWPEYYPWIDERGYRYFRKRLTEARRDVQHGLAITLDYYTTREQQQKMLEVLQFKLDILWTMLDCMWMAYIENKPPYHNITG